MTSHLALAHVVVGGTVGGLPPRVVRDAVRLVLRSEHRTATVAVTFLNPRRMRQLNAEYKHHDCPTDVLSFALPLPDGTLAGDIYVCPWVAAREAHSRGISVREELVRLVVHGALHVLGYDHPDGDSRTVSDMWRRQERYVKGLA